MALGDPEDHCLCAEPSCFCNSQLMGLCTCSSPRCTVCSALLGPRVQANTTSPASSIYEAIPRTTSRIFSDNGIWGTGTAHFRSSPTEGAPQNSFGGFIYLAIPVPPRLGVELNARAQANLPNVPFPAVMRHNQTIITAEAAMNQSPHRTMAASNASTQRLTGRGERQLVSSASESDYIFTPSNTPQQQNPRVAATNNGESMIKRTSYANRYFGGGKVNLKKSKGRAKKSPWENENLMAEDSSFLYDQNHRQKIRSLLEHSVTGNIVGGCSLHELPGKNAQRAVETFQSDGICRFNDPEFVAEAIGASERRVNGEFEGYEDSQFNDNWIDSNSASEYEDGVEMSSLGLATYGVDGTSDERGTPRYVPVVKARRSVGGFDGADDNEYHEEEFDESEDDEVLIPTRDHITQNSFQPRRDDEDDDASGEGLSGLSSANSFSNHTSMRQAKQHQTSNDNQDDGQSDCYDQQGRQSSFGASVSSSSLSTPSPPSSTGLLPANRNMLNLTNSELKFEVLYYIKNFKGRNIIQYGDILRFTVAVGDKKDKEEASKDILLLGSTGLGASRNDGTERPKGVKIAIPPGQHARSEPHLREDIEFPNDERPSAIYGTLEMVKCLHIVDPRFKKVTNIPWKKIAIIRNGKDLGTLWDIRNAYNFLQNERDFESQLEFTQIRQRRISEGQRKEGYQIVGKSTGLYRKIRKDDYNLYNKELLIDLGEELNNLMSTLAEPDHMIVMVDIRMLIPDGITGPDGATFEDTARLGPNVYPTAFTRELAGGSQGTWSLGHAHIGPIGLGWAAPGHVDPRGVPMYPWEKEAVANFHENYVYEKIKHFPLPINRARKLHCGNSSWQYKRGADGVSWTLDVNGPSVIGTGVPTSPPDGREGLSNHKIDSNLRKVSRAATHSYDPDAGSSPWPGVMPTFSVFGSAEQDANANYEREKKDERYQRTMASIFASKEAARLATATTPARHTPFSQYTTPQQFARAIYSANHPLTTAQSGYTSPYKSPYGHQNSPYNSNMVADSFSASPYSFKTAHTSDVPGNLADSLNLDFAASSGSHASAYPVDPPYNSRIEQNVASLDADMTDSDSKASPAPYATPCGSAPAFPSNQGQALPLMRPSSAQPWRMKPAYSSDVPEFAGQPVEPGIAPGYLTQEFPPYVPPYSFDPHCLPDNPRFFGQPPQIVFPFEFDGYQEQLAMAPVPSKESAPISLGHSSAGMVSSQTSHEIDPTSLETQPPRQEYPSPPLGGLSGKFFPEHQQNYSTLQPQALPYDQKVRNIEEAAFRGTYMDPNFNKEDADLVVSDLLVGQIAHKRRLLEEGAIDGEGERVSVACNGDIGSDSSAPPVKRARG